jgi:Amt family ammonium transporter
VHALGGAWGALASGIFAVTLGAGVESNAQQIMIQLRGIGFVVLFAPIMTFLILGGLRLVFGSLRVAEEDEVEGLDLSQHSESAYGFAGGSIPVEAAGLGSSQGVFVAKTQQSMA